LAAVPPELTSAAIMLCDGTRLVAGDFARHRFTMQSVAKLILLFSNSEKSCPGKLSQLNEIFSQNEIFSCLFVFSLYKMTLGKFENFRLLFLKLRENLSIVVSELA
jgi:hypothetical protein